jgi:hypothetical protein
LSVVVATVVDTKEAPPRSSMLDVDFRGLILEASSLGTFQQSRQQGPSTHHSRRNRRPQHMQAF